MDITAFYPYVLPETLGAPDPTVQQAIVMAASEFCRETLAWTETQDPIALVNNTSSYDIDVPAQAYALTVLDVWLGSRRLEPITMSDLQMVMPGWRTATASEPTHYNQAAERAVIQVFPIPTDVVTTDGLVMRAVYVPAISATTLPDFLAYRHVEAIACGAKSRLMAIPGQAWSNPVLSAYYKTRFDEAVIDTRMNELHDRVKSTLKVAPRRFGF